MSLGVHVDAPSVVHDAGIFGDQETLVVIVLRCGVRYCAQDGRWHPTHRLFDAAVYVRKPLSIFHYRHPVRPDDSIELLVCFVLRVWE